MPSLSPGVNETSSFGQVFPGAPNAGSQTLTSLVFRWKRYIIYISGKQVNILRSPTELVQAITLDDEVVAVTAEPADRGRFAVASTKLALVYKPVTPAWSQISWAQELVLKTEEAKNRLRTLSWSTEGELLIGGETQLSLYNTSPASKVVSPTESSATELQVDERVPLWSKCIANAVRFAAFSPDACLIATAGARDRLIKIWRRLSYEEAVFDYAYLPHDGVVTHFEWRLEEKTALEQEVSMGNTDKGHHGSEETCDVLYSVSSSGTMFIWQTNSHNDPDVLSLYTTIDLVSAIPHSPVWANRSTSSQRPARFVFVLPASSYANAVAVALRKHNRGGKHAIEHIKEVSSKDPDIIVALDTQGRMSAWGLSSVGHKRRPDSSSEVAKSPFHVAHSENIGLGFSQHVPTSFETWFDGDILNITAHVYGQAIKWWNGTVENFSSSAALDFDRGQQIALWQGCTSDAIGCTTTTTTGSDLLFWTSKGQLTQWSASTHNQISKTRTIDCEGDICDIGTVQHGKSLLIVSSGDVRLARVVNDSGDDLRSHPLTEDEDLTLLRLQGVCTAASESFIVYDQVGMYCSVQVNLFTGEANSSFVKPTLEVSERVAVLPLGAGVERKIAFVQVTAKAHPRKYGWTRLIGIDGAGNIYRRDVSDVVLFFRGTDHVERDIHRNDAPDDLRAGDPILADPDTDRGATVARIRQSNESIVVEDTLVFVSDRKAENMVATSTNAAISSNQGTELAIFELQEGYLEYCQTFPQSIKHMVFQRETADGTLLTEHNLLAISNDVSIDILIRSRYDHMHEDDSLHWILAKRLTIAGIGLRISCMTFLDDNRLAIAAGNSVLVSDDTAATAVLSNDRLQRLELHDEWSTSMNELCSMLSSTLVCWQPRVLRQLILHGFLDAAIDILLQLQTRLRFFTNGDKLDATLNLDIEHLLRHRHGETNDESLDFSELGDQLRELDLPYTSDEDQARLQLMVSTVSYVSRHRQALDVHATRYLAHWRYHVLLASLRTQQRNPNGTTNHALSHGVNGAVEQAAPTMTWREINFASQSTTQQPLLELLIQHYDNKLDWNIVRSLGITLWLRNIKAAQSEGTNVASVEQVLDVVAQSAYRATYPANPADASLFLLAQRKKAVLLSLWRVAVGNREQKSTQNFLRRDFDVEENRVAARKNAYALMGRRRFEYAAAFFLLADDPASAISILAGQCEDLHLAVSVARVYCGDDSPILRNLMQERVIPLAQNSHDRWLLALAYSIMCHSSQMLDSLVMSFNHSEVLQKSIRTWQQDDPVAVLFYRELRDSSSSAGQTSQTRDSSALEYRAVLRSARLLRRMGMWLLAVKLVQHWEFTRNETASPAEEVGSAFVANDPSSINGTSSILDQYAEDTISKTAQSCSVSGSSNVEGFKSQDSFMQDAQPPATDAEVRAAKAAAILAKMREKNATNGVSKAGNEAKPTQFAEPAASSILDSFGF